MSKSPSERIAVIPAGGQGSRLGWLGKFLPKSLVPIGTKPILHNIISNLVLMNISEVYVLVDYKKNLIKSYLKEQKEFSKIKFHFVNSHPNLGLADVVALTSQKIKIPFVVILGDDFTQSKNISKFPHPKNFDEIVAQEAVIKEKDRKLLAQTCEVYLNRKRLITKAVEKPQNPKSNYRGAGLYLFQPEIFNYIKKTPISKKTGKREITDTVNLVAKDNKACSWPINGINININTEQDLEKATKLSSVLK